MIFEQRTKDDGTAEIAIWGQVETELVAGETQGRQYIVTDENGKAVLNEDGTPKIEHEVYEAALDSESGDVVMKKYPDTWWNVNTDGPESIITLIREEAVVGELLHVSDGPYFTRLTFVSRIAGDLKLQTRPHPTRPGHTYVETICPTDSGNIRVGLDVILPDGTIMPVIWGSNVEVRELSNQQLEMQKSWLSPAPAQGSIDESSLNFIARTDQQGTVHIGTSNFPLGISQEFPDAADPEALALEASTLLKKKYTSLMKDGRWMVMSVDAHDTSAGTTILDPTIPNPLWLDIALEAPDQLPESGMGAVISEDGRQIVRGNLSSRDVVGFPALIIIDLMTASDETPLDQIP